MGLPRLLLFHPEWHPVLSDLQRDDGQCCQYDGDDPEADGNFTLMLRTARGGDEILALGVELLIRHPEIVVDSVRLKIRCFTPLRLPSL